LEGAEGGTEWSLTIGDKPGRKDGGDHRRGKIRERKREKAHRRVKRVELEKKEKNKVRKVLGERGGGIQRVFFFAPRGGGGKQEGDCSDRERESILQKKNVEVAHGGTQ